jgi:hypothetical protein
MKCTVDEGDFRVVDEPNRGTSEEESEHALKSANADHGA